MNQVDPMSQIMEKVDQVATDFLKLLEQQLHELNITDPDMVGALQYAIIKKMETKVKLPK